MQKVSLLQRIAFESLIK